MNGEECLIPIVLGLACLFIYLFIYSLLAPSPFQQLFQLHHSIRSQKALGSLLHFHLAPLASWGLIE